MPSPKDKKKGPAKSRATSNCTTSNVAARPKERTSANPRMDLRPNASVLENPRVVEKLLQRLVLPTDQVELDKLDLDRAIMRFFHFVG